MKHTALLRVCCGTNGLPYMLRVNALKAMTEQATLRGGALNLLQCRALVQISVYQLQLLPPVFLGSQSSVSREDATVLKHTRGFVL